MTRKTQISWTVIILVSLAFQLMFVLLEAGFYSTPYGTLDSSGNELGFNNLITSSHVEIMLSNIGVRGLFGGLRWYFVLCLGAHVAGLVVVWGSFRRRGRLMFFGLQTILFPLGWIPLLWMGPLMAIDSLLNGFDGEAITDGPLNMIFVHVTWWFVSLALFLWNLGMGDQETPQESASLISIRTIS